MISRVMKEKNMSFCHLDFYNPLIQQLILSDPAVNAVLSHDLDWDGSPSDLYLAVQLAEELETARGVPESEGVRSRIMTALRSRCAAQQAAAEGAAC